MIYYALSRGQQKELSERGRELRLLLPDDGEIPDDQLLDHARRVLDVPASWIRSATPVTVAVRPYWGERPQQTGVAGVLGGIIQDDQQIDPGTGAVCLEAIEVVVCAIGRPRGRTRRQWPGRYTYSTHD